jgi:hypothetical protein
MPFRYFGGKKALARHYPPPRHLTIIEPLAGSAGYSLWHATPDHHVVLVEKDERIVNLWTRLQGMSLDELMGITCPPLGQRCTEPLVNLTAASENTMRSARFHNSQVTSRMVEKWPGSQAYIARKLDAIRDWTIVHGDWSAALELAPDEATWFVDPPYQPRPGQRAGSRGDGYAKHCNSQVMDYGRLGKACVAEMPGQVIAVDTVGADWLPFRPFRLARTTAPGRGVSTDNLMRAEAVWLNDEAGAT